MWIAPCIWYEKYFWYPLYSPYPIYHPIFWQCVWQIRKTVSLYHSSFRQCPWHIRSTTISNFLNMCVTYQENCITVWSHFPTMSVTYQANYLVKGRDGEKKWGEKNRENNGGKSDNYDVASQSPNSNRLQRRCFCLFSYYGCDISKELYHLIIPFSDNAHDISNKPTGSVDCVWIIFFVFSIWAKHHVFLF